MEKLFNARWWDYSNFKFNLNGRICLRNSVLFGVLGLLLIYTINPFISNEVLLPSEALSYGDKINASYKYFHPKEKDLNPLTNEYLVQGKVKVLERVM